MQKIARFAPAILLAVVATIATAFFFEWLTRLTPGEGGEPNRNLAAAITATSTFVYTFNSDGVLQEAGSMQESTSPYWWLDSGGKLLLQSGLGSTVQGELPSLDKWRLAYLKSNPVDTDQGYHPQNLLRLLTKQKGDNIRSQAQFKIVKDNFSASPNRNASNGLLLMMRYQDYKTLYYAGIRVDGTAVIKKKYNGTYYTMAQKSIFPGTYVPGGSVNLLPHGEWIGLRSETFTNADGSVTVRLFMQRAGQSTWTKLLEVRDSGQYGGTQPIRAAGYTGIRTDFMDVQFDTFRAEAIVG
ncbi:MAG: hypothetical protein HYS26_02495 [Candidatus Kaiserbacteria bacterium]|nr:MAG: hypothetical protein HYS26_02495 [Candidatus Kaiserbacteria bacterium]